MTIRELLNINRPARLPVGKGGNPIVAFQDEVNRLFQDFFGDMSLPSWLRPEDEATLAIMPATDMIENGKGIRITAELPGIDVKDVQVTVANGYITIRGEKKRESKEEQEGYYRRERSYGSFQRILALPETADTDRAESTFSKGVLTVSIPKKAGVKPEERKLDIKQAA